MLHINEKQTQKCMSLQIWCTEYFKLLQFATLECMALQYRANQSAATWATERFLTVIQGV